MGHHAVAGTVIAGRYRLIEPLGAGGMGSVWRAEHIQLRSPIAIKLLNPAIAASPEMAERFLREAQSAAALRGAYVVQVFDYGVEGGSPHIAMELLNGQSLAQRIEQRGRLALKDLAWVFAQVSRAVSKAHELGIVHRDLKPDNIFIVAEGEEETAKVLDFGIAKFAEGSALLSQSSGNTRTGTIMGTPYYMSPEQARGNKAVDFRSDLWSMGIIAFECITGQLPFMSTALGDLVIQICTLTPAAPSTLGPVPAGFDDWFFRACCPSPDGRFRNMREQNDELQKLLNAATSPAIRRERGTETGYMQTALPSSRERAPTALASASPGRAASEIHQDNLAAGRTQIAGQVPTATPVEVSVQIPLRKPVTRTTALFALLVLAVLGLARWLQTSESRAPNKPEASSDPPIPSLTPAEAAKPAKEPAQSDFSATQSPPNAMPTGTVAPEAAPAKGTSPEVHSAVQHDGAPPGANAAPLAPAPPPRAALRGPGRTDPPAQRVPPPPHAAQPAKEPLVPAPAPAKPPLDSQNPADLFDGRK